ncbi:MAG TPA: VanZ family protein [Thermoleophilaceae bacterium]
MTRTPMRLLSKLDPWGPPLALMAVIFLLSAQPDLSTGLGIWDQIGRKLVHALEYGALCFLWWRALRTVAAWPWALVAAFCVSLGYAGTDEFHQTFVEGRHGAPIDVLIDSTGMVAAALLIARRRP